MSLADPDTRNAWVARLAIYLVAFVVATLIVQLATWWVL